ncbi:MAG: plastocyanin/azurin family copper-binding protein [Nitrosopumilus sp.]|nr:plastocyanin/azurin family copper-binding protein [Nitrosopumilus sp.]MDH5430712.1 plastocyanin/azurin family copper-binding protein [Nitrosopumilus sp.]MDH5665217.1 plastocyanin/azurin family copper-binding protein [Nitrosopumilus sp.]MDH5697757.1 plastocyanin/azurin family copper-binding protein [Nitrosopumilus sp.]
MLKILSIIGTIVVIILVIIGLILSNTTVETNSEEQKLVVKGDIIMPTKVSRPGCEEIDRCYIPSVIVIDSGKQVTWVNQDSAFHSVTSGFYGEPTELFDSGHMDPFESYTLTFDDVGTFDYFCTLHPWMKGQVIVE